MSGVLESSSKHPPFQPRPSKLKANLSKLGCTAHCTSKRQTGSDYFRNPPQHQAPIEYCEWLDIIDPRFHIVLKPPPMVKYSFWFCSPKVNAIIPGSVETHDQRLHASN